MDFFPSVFSQNDLFWLDNLMPASNKKKKEKKNGLSKVGTSEVCENSDIRQFYLTEKIFRSWKALKMEMCNKTSTKKNFDLNKYLNI